MRLGRLMVVALLTLSAAGCKVRMGGPSPVNQNAVAVRLLDTATPDEIAAALQQHAVTVAILSSTHDSTWYANLASKAGMKMSRAGHVGNETFAFLGPTALGDTTLSLKVQGGGEILLHDALYRIDKNRRMDVMAVRIEPNANLRESVRSLLSYVATDVLANAAVIFAIEPPTPAIGDSVSVLMRAAFSDAWECSKEGRGGARNTELPIRLFYGPAMHIRCSNAEQVAAGGPGMLGHFVIGEY